MYNGKNDYQKGVNNLRMKRTHDARKFFKKSYNDPNFKENAIIGLIGLDITEGKYKRARSMLEENSLYRNNPQYNFYYGLLENMEYNFHQSRDYYNRSKKDLNYLYKSKLKLANLDIQLGKYDSAKKIIEEVRRNPKNYVKATFSLIELNIILEQYEDAYFLLLTLENSITTDRLREIYSILENYCLYYMGKLRKDDANEYTIYRLFNNSDEVLIDHIKDHLNKREKYSYGCFFKDLDLNKLVNDAKNSITDFNSRQLDITDIYSLKMDYPIGFKENEITQDLCVVTLKNKTIITMYPIMLSDKFDNEGFSRKKVSK